MYRQARGERTAVQVVANDQSVQSFRSFAAPKKVVHTGGTQDPIRGFCNPYSIGFSAISRSLAESPSLSANDYAKYLIEHEDDQANRTTAS